MHASIIDMTLCLPVHHVAPRLGEPETTVRGRGVVMATRECLILGRAV